MWCNPPQPTSPTDYGRPCPRRNKRVRSSPLQSYAIVAGAGSGKTQTMGLRVAWLVANGQVEPQRVLGLTFTRKAAAELSQRIRRMLRGLVVADERDPFLEPDVAAALAAGEPTCRPTTRTPPPWCPSMRCVPASNRPHACSARP